jgi:hypothetical protein
MDSIQALFSSWQGKFVGNVLFACPSVGNKFKLSVFSPTWFSIL